MKHLYGPKDETDRCRATAVLPSQDGSIRMGLISPDNRENFIMFAPEEARKWAASLVKYAAKTEGRARKAV